MKEIEERLEVIEKALGINRKEKPENGQWRVFAEELPGHDKILVRVEDAEKSICSGWDCKGGLFVKQFFPLSRTKIYVEGRFKINLDNLFNRSLENIIIK